MTKKVPLGEDRRAAIADAAIHLVATRGLRGLTHRAVDEEAGLPPGSTSYYLRTRGALLAACVNRMLERDLARGAHELPADPELEELLAGMVLGLVRDRPDDLIARYELSLEASRQPELRDAIIQGGRRLRESLADLLAGLGVPDADTIAWPVAAMMDGLLYDRVAGAGTTLSPEAFEAAVRRSLAALLSGLRHA
ncbi:TetR/AcrR family transcriptional regulator [Kribbella sp. CA-293567]|uniref:TetR/AcrR family transcriptional regulator n=1 Tax=Kribbella sp. CA-293567 TaxID=3002436 RepID=UPI0022DD1C57|nr:TetR/AcrR family transcriptional regulator [Kribbella sp. CA-293567]WBQ05921.1 TetR family transcriptional regulator C-terminal domain-containing protein [Kribbella sp. CA-293567]